MKKLFALVLVTAIGLASLSPVVGGYFDRAPIYENCYVGMDRHGNPVTQLRQVDCYPAIGYSCLPQTCLVVPF